MSLFINCNGFNNYCCGLVLITCREGVSDAGKLQNNTDTSLGSCAGAGSRNLRSQRGVSKSIKMSEFSPKVEAAFAGVDTKT